MIQLASETLNLREQLLRTKSDNRGADNALANAQEDLAAALSRAQACEEAYEPLFAELESLKVQLRTVDGGPGKGKLPYAVWQRMMLEYNVVLASTPISDILKELVTY